MLRADQRSEPMGQAHSGTTGQRQGAPMLLLVRHLARQTSARSEVARNIQLVLDTLPSFPGEPGHHRNVAIVHLIFSTGLLPVEVAGLTIGDYLDPSGDVRSSSQVPAEVAFNRKPRPLLFVNEALVEAVDAYLDERVARAPTAPKCYRGLIPDGRLILGDRGQPFRFQHQSGVDGRRSCRGFAKLCARLFAVARKKYGLQPSIARRLLARELYREGADPKALQAIFGLSRHRKVLGLIRLELSEEERLEAAIRAVARTLRSFR